MNYAELQTEVANYLHRTDLGGQIPTFIATAEAMMFRELNIKVMEASVTGTTVDGYAVLPNDFSQVTRVSVSNGGSALALDYLSPGQYSTAVEAYPKYYSLENGKLRLWGTATGATYTLYYIPVIAPLSGSNTSNWLLANAQDLYLYAAALEGAKYTRNQQEVQNLTPLVTGLVDSITRQSKRIGMPSGSMRIGVRAFNG